MLNSHEYSRPGIVELREDELDRVAGADLYVREIVLIAAYKAGLLQPACADGQPGTPVKSKS